MVYHIQKLEDIQGQLKEIYYEGEYRWTTVFEDRKIYPTEEDATADLYDFGGTVVSE